MGFRVRTRHRPARGSRDGRDEAGFSLLELIVAMTVFAIFSTGVYGMINSGITLARNDKNRSIAANLASQEMDKVRAADFTTLPVGLVSSTQSVDGALYTVQRESEWVARNTTTSPCDSAGATPSYLRVSVKVSWSAMGGVDPVESNTVVRPPVGAYDPNAGHIAVKILDRDAAPSVAQPVRVVGTGVNAVISTTSDGCAFFGYLNPGTYTVSLSTAGYVDRQGASNPSQSVGVFSGQVSSVGFDYDESASLAVSITAPDGGIIPSSLPVTIANTAFLPSGTRLFSGSGSTRTISGLFPSAAGYDLWTGDCARSDPEGVDSVGNTGAYWSGAQRSFEATTTPGDPSTLAILVPTVRVAVLRAGQPVAGITVRATNPSDSQCVTGNTYSFGPTAADGTVNVALPFGQWTIAAVSQTASGAWPVVAVDPRNVSPSGPGGPYSAAVNIQ
ncbi:MAG: type IV pilus modification PilV family protein [Acidimicrobiia bacterium]